jgi:hypothetical protein
LCAAICRNNHAALCGAGHFAGNHRWPKRLILSKSNVEGVKPVTTLQAILLGMMLSWTPSLALLAFLLWQDGIGLDEGAG